MRRRRLLERTAIQVNGQDVATTAGSPHMAFANAHCILKRIVLLFITTFANHSRLSLKLHQQMSIQVHPRPASKMTRFQINSNRPRQRVSMKEWLIGLIYYSTYLKVVPINRHDIYESISPEFNKLHLTLF